MIVILLAVFAAGVLTRIADTAADDGLNLNKYLGYAIGALYGFLIAYVITQYPVLAELAVAVLLSVIVTGKIDNPIHYMGIGAAIFFLALYGLAPLNLALLAVFIAGGIADEAGNYLSDKGRLGGIAGYFFRYRMAMEAVTFTLSACTGNWIFFLAMLSYDTGYTYIFPAAARRKLIRFALQR